MRALGVGSCKYGSDVINLTAGVRDKPDMHSPYRKSYGRENAVCDAAPVPETGLSPRREKLKTEPKAEAFLLP